MADDRRFTRLPNFMKGAGGILDQLTFRQLVPTLTTGALIAVIEFIVAVSFAALIFAGDLSSFIAQGTGLALFGAAIAGVVTALWSSIPGTIGGNQDVPATILAVTAVNITAAMPSESTSQEKLITLVATIAITTIVCGLFFYGLGTFKLGGLVRFVPFPVIGGFLAGTGWLLVIGGIALMVDLPAGLSQLSLMLDQRMLLRWLPGAGLGVALLLLSRRVRHALLMPGMILASVVVFYLVGLVAGVSPNGLGEQGWLLGPFATPVIWQPLTISDLAQVNWTAIWQNAPGLLAAPTISAVALLLNASGLELAVEADVDLNRDMRAAGLGNLLSGLGAGFVGYQQLSMSSLTVKSGGHGRLAGLTGALLLLTLLFSGSAAIAYFPKAVLGGLLVFLGLDFIVTWVFEAWFRLPKIDLLIVVVILIVIASVGFLEGLAVGTVAAVVMFVVNYSWIDVIRHDLSGQTFHSRVSRSGRDRHILRQAGHRVAILQLQGFLFFGTAHKLLERVRSRVRDAGEGGLLFILLDFRQVSGLDSTALYSFSKMNQLVQRSGIMMIIVGLVESVRQRFAADGLIGNSDTIRVFPGLDDGLEWCENRILAEAKARETGQPDNLASLFARLPATEAWSFELLQPFLEYLELPGGEVFIRRGDSPDDLFFVDSGQVTARVRQPNGEVLRLETMRGGRVVGELGFYLGIKRTADVVTDEPSSLFRLTRKAMEEMEQSHPEIASGLHRLILQLLAERVTHLVEAVEALQQ